MPNPSGETKFSGANAGREILIFPVQLATSRIGNLARLIILLLLYVMTTLDIVLLIRPFALLSSF